MSDSLKSIRVVGAWTILVAVALIQLFLMVDWWQLADMVGHGPALAMSIAGTGMNLLLLPAIAVAITGLGPPALSARAVALVAFIEYAVLLVWGVIGFSNLITSRMANTFDPGFFQPPLYGVVMTTFGVVALAAVGAFFAWRVFIALDRLTREIVDLYQQIEELDAQED